VSGAAVGGGVGAVVGATIGAGVGTIWWLRHDRQETLPQGTSIVFSLNNSLQLTPATSQAAENKQ
jgi:outer membrane lipoprotein SlyB